jgi:SnoaL-like protein
MSDDVLSDAEPLEEHRGRLAITARWSNAPDPASSQLIQNLVQAYALYTDTGRIPELATLFTADAVWDGRALRYGYAEGPEAIAATACGHFRASEPMMHLPGPALLTAVADDEVHGVCWCLATRWTQGSTIPLIHFYYEDVLRRGDDGLWRFQRRFLRPAFPR